jgi:tRNA dimethylallyltransferase
MEGIEEGGRRPLLVGGSGLYFRAAVDQLEFPATEAATRTLLEAEAAAAGPEALYRRLEATDPAAAARIEPGNVRRTVRALEVAAVTGRPFSSFAEAWERYPAGHVRAAGVEVPRPILYARIERRVEEMLPGLLEETRALLDAGFGGFLTATQAIGYLEAAACLRGELDEAEVAARTVKRTKALARRQLSWFRRDPRVRWFPVGEEGAIGAADAIIGYLGATEDAT